MNRYQIVYGNNGSRKSIIRGGSTADEAVKSICKQYKWVYNNPTSTTLNGMEYLHCTVAPVNASFTMDCVAVQIPKP